MEKKLRVLYLDLYLDYIAPTRNLLPFLLKKVFDVTFYGPGYVSDELLELGVEKFIENKGKFDFIITNEHIFFNAQKNISESIFVNIYKKNYVLNFNANLIFSSINNMFIFFKTTNIDKLLIILETDYYCLDNKIIDSIYSSNANVVTEGKQFIKSVSELENLKYEKFGRKANDYWYDFVNKYDDKILSLSQFVGESEFSFIHFLNKKNLQEQVASVKSGC